MSIKCVYNCVTWNWKHCWGWKNFLPLE